MMMDGEEEGNRGGGEEIESYESNPRAETEIAQAILNLIESVAHLGGYPRTHKKYCFGLVRRMKLLLPLLEEIRDYNEQISEKGISCLSNLKETFLLAEKLLKVCSEGSKIDLAVESEAFMVKFRTIDEKLCQALEGVPFDQLGISDETKEQVELMWMQLKRAKGKTDTLDVELEMDMMAVLSKKDGQNADSAIIERLAKKLDLHTVEDLNNETIAIRNLVKERGGFNAENILQITDLLKKFKQIIGMEVTDVLNNPVMPETLDICTSLVIPHEFLCPIMLETYEKESIEKWFNSNHWTCPKTGQTLAHLSVTPNYALKNLILQWCEENKFHLPKKADCASSESSTDHSKGICSLVKDLSCSHLEMLRKAVKKIRMLSKENAENRILIASKGGIQPLIQILFYPDSEIQEHSVTALLNLSLEVTNKRLIVKRGGVPAIIEVLQHGRRQARENSAAALFSLSMLYENKIIVGLSNGIPPLVDLLQSGTQRGKKDAVSALFNLSLNHSNKGRAIDAGIVTTLVQLLKDKNLGIVDEALSFLLLLVSHPEGRSEIGQISCIESLVEFIKEGNPKNKEYATSVLLELGSSNSSFILAALQFGVYEHLLEISTSGTHRAQKKANSLLQLINKTEQI
ncbi:U-box domain-containing protein 15 isoform X3 [Manihot esculenta]|uniref:U-box domain-containing protein 15 isoform X3 n=1 Tax=Manihot esculenta TaxID=3983 RepID=UPI000B5D66CC|nr:U-box domain-containing protein 15 isoform X3 [Manihot esculenta]